LLLGYWSTSSCGESVAHHGHPKYKCKQKGGAKVSSPYVFLTGVGYKFQVIA